MLLFYVLYIIYCISLYFCLMWRINFIIVTTGYLKIMPQFLSLLHNLEAEEDTDSVYKIELWSLL